MDRHQDDAKVQEKACGTLWNLAFNDASKATLMLFEVFCHARVVESES
jgi:hypothetical protein